MSKLVESDNEDGDLEFPESSENSESEDEYAGMQEQDEDNTTITQ